MNDTQFHGLHFSFHLSLDLHVYSGADWLGDLIDHQFTMSYFFLLSDSLISWIAPFSTEVEYRAFAYTTFELFWLCWLL